jgi:hypothetical protein
MISMMFFGMVFSMVSMSMLIQVGFSANASLIVLQHFSVLDAHPTIQPLLLVHTHVHCTIVTQEISKLLVSLRTIEDLIVSNSTLQGKQLNRPSFDGVVTGHRTCS